MSKKAEIIEENLKHKWFMQGWNSAMDHYQWWDVKTTWFKLFVILLLIDICLTVFF